MWIGFPLPFVPMGQFVALPAQPCFTMSEATFGLAVYSAIMVTVLLFTKKQ